MKEFNPDSLTDLLKAKYLEIKDSQIGKYFFMYFLHLMGFLGYEEKDTIAIYSDKKDIFKVDLPIIDSKEKFDELERIHKNLEKFSKLIKKKFKEQENQGLSFISDLIS